MKSPIEIVDLERGIHSCSLYPLCKVDAVKKVIEIEWKKDVDGFEGVRKTTYYCGKHFPKELEEE